MCRIISSSLCHECIYYNGEINHSEEGEKNEDMDDSNYGPVDVCIYPELW